MNWLVVPIWYKEYLYETWTQDLTDVLKKKTKKFKFKEFSNFVFEIDRNLENPSESQQKHYNSQKLNMLLVIFSLNCNWFSSLLHNFFRYTFNQICHRSFWKFSIYPLCQDWVFESDKKCYRKQLCSDEVN